MKPGGSYIATSNQQIEPNKPCNGATCSDYASLIELLPDGNYKVSIENIQSDIFISFGYGDYPPMRP